MKSSPRTAEPTGFEDLLQNRLLNLAEGISSASFENIEAELSQLKTLIDRYRRNDELLEELLEPGTTRDQREQIRETLKSQHMIVAQNRADLERLHAASHQLLERSAQLLAQIDRQVYKRTNKGSAYAPEICGYCKGLGGSTKTVCPACDGRRTVLVLQPPLVCPRCNGKGKPDSHVRNPFFSDFCIICRGQGWVLTSQAKAAE